MKITRLYSLLKRVDTTCRRRPSMTHFSDVPNFQITATIGNW